MRRRALDRSLDLIFRLFCLGQLFTCIRPNFLVAWTQAWDAEGLAGLAAGMGDALPVARWVVYGACAAVAVFGARKPFVMALGVGQILDVAVAIATNSVESGYSEKGVLLFVSVGAMGLLAMDRGDESDRSNRLGPSLPGSMRFFLRASASIAFAAIALNKMNQDFLDPVRSCSRMLNEGLMRVVPLMAPFAEVLSHQAWGALVMEALLLPLLLFAPRFGVLYAWGFFANVALVGPRATCFVFMALALFFLPPEDFERFDWKKRWLGITVCACVALALLFWVVTLIPDRRFDPRHLLPRVIFLTLGLSGISLLAANLVVSLRAGGVRRVLTCGYSVPALSRPVGVLIAVLLGGLLLNELAPHLGLKTKYSLTMWSNLRSDEGRANSYVFPEFLRVASGVDEALLQVTQIRRLQATPEHGERRSGPEGRLPSFVASHDTAKRHLIRLEKGHGSLEFRVRRGGDEHAFQGVEGEFSRFLEETKPRVDWFEDAVMTFDTPQGCLGP